MSQKIDKKKNFKKMRKLTPLEIKINKVENFIYEWKEEINSWFAVTIFGIVIFVMYFAVVIDEIKDLFSAKKMEDC